MTSNHSSKRRQNNSLSKEQRTMDIYFKNARSRAKAKKLKFNIDHDYLLTIKTTHCPVFNTLLTWNNPYKDDDSPELDQIVDGDGYIKGNVAFISRRANRIKDSGTMQEHFDIGDYIWNAIENRDKDYAEQKELASVPKGIYRKSEKYSEHGTVSAAGAWQNSHDAYHYSRAIQGQDIDHSTQASSGNGVGRGGKEMGPPQASFCFEDNGVTYGKIVSYEELCRHIFDKP